MKIAGSFMLAACLSGHAAGQIKTPQPEPVKVPVSRSLQLMVVTTDGWGAPNGSARLFERTTADSKWRSVGNAFRVVIGRGGMAPDAMSELEFKTSVSAKVEGDGKAPAGIFPLSFAFGSKTRPPPLHLSFLEVVPSTECVDDPNSSHYNKIVDRYKVGNFDWKSSEKMLDVGEEYEMGVFIGYNSFPVKSDAGSCIFLHIWKDSASPTSGCTAMAREEIARIVGWLDPKKNPFLIQMPGDQYKKIRRSWKLPATE